MTQFYRIPKLSGASSVSVDGIEHKINPDTGLLEVDVMTPGLANELKQWEAVMVDPNANRTGSGMGGAAPLTAEEKIEREALLAELDKAAGRQTDRRRSLAQLRQAKAELDRTGQGSGGGAPKE